MSLAVSIAHRLGAFRLRADFACEGRLTALFGPSGSGKTSIVNTIAGLLRPERATIVIDDVTLTDTGAGVSVPTHRRNIGYVFQEARLFPHMSVRQNLLYAQWFGGRRASSGASFQDVVEMLGVEALLKRYPSHLSGGEKQRVAIGRALLSNPRLLLMDEPLASLDEARKQEILPYIERLRDEANVPIVYVSHSIAEVRRLADYVVVMENGEVAAIGPPAIALGERSHMAIRHSSKNLLDVLDVEALPGGGMTLRTAAGALKAPHAASKPSRLAIHDESVIIALDKPGRTSATNVLAGTIVAFEGDGPSRRLRVRAGEADLVLSARGPFIENNNLRAGAQIYLLVNELTLL